MIITSKGCAIKNIRKLMLLLFFSLFLSNITMANSVSTITYSNQGNILTIDQKLTIKELFDLISNRTQYDFFFNSSLNGLNNKVKIAVTKASVSHVLDLALQNQNIEYSIKEHTISVREKSKKQEKLKITGNIKDEYDIPLFGVNIVIKNTATGTSSDFDGNFNIEITTGDTLIISYLGFKDQLIKTDNRISYSIVMHADANMLNEVIVAGVASGTSRKKLSISVAKLKTEDLNKAPQTSVSASLQGKIAGVTVTSLSGSPGASSNIVLRGATSIVGNNSPMILMDGIIMGGALADINVDDIASIEVVKGAAASSLYGSQAANGVIVITSKRGKDLQDGKTSVTLRNEIGYQNVAKFLDLSTSHHYSLDPTWLDTDTYTKYQFVNYPTDYISGWDPRITGNRVEKANHYQDLPYRVNNDLQEQMFTNGQYLTQYISVGHRVNKTNLFASFENNENQGVVIETGGYKRQSFRLNIDHYISDALKISASNNYITTNNDFLGGGTGAFFDVLMTEPDVDLFKDNANGQRFNFYPNNWNTQFSNPLYDLWKKESTSKKTRFLGAYKLDWKINSIVSLQLSYGFEKEHYNRNYYSPQSTIIDIQPNYIDPNAIPLVLDPNNPIASLYSGGSLSNEDYEAFNQSFRATLNFKKTWKDLDFNGKLSYLGEQNYYKSTTTFGKSFVLADFPTFNNFDPLNIDSSGTTRDINAINYFAIASFVYKDRYIFDGLYRIDGSSLFGENERWQNYFRVSGAYRISKDFKIPGIQELKLRAAYGTSGLRPSFGAKDETFSLSDGITTKNTLGNKNLKPSRSAELEIGIETSFLNRFRLEATYSNTKVTDQYLLAPLAAHTGGFRYQNVNAGELESNTFEAMFTAKIISTDNFSWDATLTFDRTRQKITKLDIPEYRTGPRSAFRIKEGETYGTMYGVGFIRTLDQMQNQLPEGDNISNYSINRDGVVVKSDDIGTINESPIAILDENGAEKVQKIGDINPDFRIGLNTSFNYKGFSMYMLWHWKQGGDLYNKTAQSLVRDNRHEMVDQIHTKPENKKTVDYYQALYDADAINEFWLEDATYVKLNEVALSYTLNKSILGNASKYIEHIKFGVIGRNLLTITNYSGYDPEVGYDGFLFDNFSYPNFRNFSLSVELKF